MQRIAIQLSRRLNEVEIACLLVALPFLLFRSPLSVLALLIILVPWLVRWRVTGRPTVRTPMDIPILCMLFMVPVGVWSSAFPAESLRKLLGIILGVALFYGVVNCAKSARWVTVWTALLVAFGVAISLLALVGSGWGGPKVLPLEPIYRRLPRLITNVPDAPQGGFNPNEVGGALALVLPVSLAACLGVWVSAPPRPTVPGRSPQSKSRGLLGEWWSGTLRARPLSFSLATLSLALIVGVFVLTQSRSAYIGVAAGLIALAVSRSLWFLLSLPLLAGIVLFRAWSVGAQSFLDSLLRLNVTGTAAGRFEIWQRALSMIQDFPYTGVGLNTFPYVGDAMYPYVLLGPNARVPHAHNNFLQIAIDLGIPGLVAYLAILTTFCICAWRVYRRSQRPGIRLLAVGLFSGMLAHQVYGLTDAITLGAKPGFLLWIMLGLMAALYRRWGM